MPPASEPILTLSKKVVSTIESLAHSGLGDLNKHIVTMLDSIPHDSVLFKITGGAGLKPSYPLRKLEEAAQAAHGVIGELQKGGIPSKTKITVLKEAVKRLEPGYTSAQAVEDVKAAKVELDAFRKEVNKAVGGKPLNDAETRAMDSLIRAERSFDEYSRLIENTERIANQHGPDTISNAIAAMPKLAEHSERLRRTDTMAIFTDNWSPPR